MDSKRYHALLLKLNTRYIYETTKDYEAGYKQGN